MNTAGNTERQPLHTGSAGHALSANIQSDDIKKGGVRFFLNGTWLRKQRMKKVGEGSRIWEKGSLSVDWTWSRGGGSDLASYA